MYPDWVTKHKQKGTNISYIRGHYYLYAVSSVWNKEKGRAQKKTNKYLGRITEDGLIPPKRRVVTIQEEVAAPSDASITTKTYGAVHVLSELGSDILGVLSTIFGAYGPVIFVLAALRLIERSPLKRIEHFYSNSFFSEMFKNLKLSGKDLSEFLQKFGGNREKIAQFMTQFLGKNNHILFDATSISSASEKMDINRTGYSSDGCYDPQIKLLYAFGCEEKSPAYYRIIPGNISDVSALKLAVTETELHDMVVVADKGFGSEENFKMLEEAGIKYIVPLKRNSALYDPSKLKTGNKGDFDGYFMFKKRPIWHYKSGETLVFMDSDLKAKEEKQYLNNIENNREGYTLKEFMEKHHKFGTIIIKSNIGKTPKEIYFLYKKRGEIEQSFDFLKNLLEQDKTYMQNEKSLETWAFINHIALMLNYKIYNLLKEKQMLSNWSVEDFIAHLKYIFKVRINEKWKTTEYTKKTKKMLEKLDIHIT
jgi:transposase